jgi:DNA replication protein DnaC
MSDRLKPVEEWICPKCSGDGFVLDASGDAVACSCRAMRLRRARSLDNSSVIPRKYRGVSFDRAPVPSISVDVVRPVRMFVNGIQKYISEGRGLWFEGDVGTGKTTLSMLVSKAALDAGFSVSIYSVPHLLAKIRDTYDRGPGERSYMEFFNHLVTVDLLHLEDLGSERRTDWVLEQLYSLINERYEEQRSILVTTNVEVGDLEAQIGQRTISRMTQICGAPLQLHGEDQRASWMAAGAEWDPRAASE